MGKPVLMLRTRIERLEALAEGTVRVIGTDEVDIIKWVQLLLDDSAAWASMAQPSQLYGDGRAADRIVYEFERRWKDGEEI